SNMMLAVAAIFVMVFPTRARLWDEARQRIVATLMGGALALAILGVATFSAHVVNLLILVFLTALFLGDRMVVGRQPPMVYQYALSSMVAIVGAALSAKAPLETTLLRVVLTMTGAVAAALLTGLLESLLVEAEALPLPAAETS
ncbi:MAG: FUSC family protein, partial [Burkholderiales bacterium]